MKAIFYFVLFYASIFLLSMIPEQQMANEGQVEDFENVNMTSDTKTSYNAIVTDSTMSLKGKL
ncbi:MAG: hypothetical protein K6E54_02615 [Bacteroidaceae bacterium]|nr:hypothetical protein [Bacteroidaceae bacterium]